MPEKILRRLHWFLNFYFSEWGAAKGAQWEELSGDREFSPQSAYTICSHIVAEEPRVSQIIDRNLPATRPARGKTR